MKTTRTYLSGCKYCGATGKVKNNDFNPNITDSTLEIVCPVCNGSKVITVTEEFDQPVFFATLPPAGEVFAVANGAECAPYVAPENRRYLIMPNADGSYIITAPLFSSFAKQPQ